MEALYHETRPDAMPCSRNITGARQIREENTVIVKLNDTTKTVGFGIVPLADYTKRYSIR